VVTGKQGSNLPRGQWSLAYGAVHLAHCLAHDLSRSTGPVTCRTWPFQVYSDQCASGRQAVK
jgi:hypothetical protein